MFRKFPSIDQFRHVVAHVRHRAQFVGLDENEEPIYDTTRQLPTVTFNGTVKLHGSNAAISFKYPEGNWETQSRERVLSLEEDNLGFHAFVSSLDSKILSDLKQYCERIVENQAIDMMGVEFITIFGEWCGKRVNGKTGIGQLDNCLFIFKIVVGMRGGTREFWIDGAELASLWNAGHPDRFPFYFIKDFKQFSIDIDFNAPENYLEALEQMTLEVENQCPVAASFGITGIGEGIVWESKTQQFGTMNFKTKGVKHKGTKNARLVTVDPEIMASTQAFVEAVLTESRLQQGADFIRQMNKGKLYPESTTDFIKWIGADVLKEEADSLKASGLDRKDVMKSVNRAASSWFKQNVDPC